VARGGLRICVPLGGAANDCPVDARDARSRLSSHDGDGADS